MGMVALEGSTGTAAAEMTAEMLEPMKSNAWLKGLARRRLWRCGKWSNRRPRLSPRSKPGSGTTARLGRRPRRSFRTRASGCERCSCTDRRRNWFCSGFWTETHPSWRTGTAPMRQLQPLWQEQMPQLRAVAGFQPFPQRGAGTRARFIGAPGCTARGKPVKFGGVKADQYPALNLRKSQSTIVAISAQP